MLEFFEMSASLLVSFGGGAVIVFGLSKWLGEIWGKRILENEKNQHKKEIEEYKSQLEISINTINSINERALHISKVQYDKEFEIYLEIWEKLNSCTVYTMKLYPDGFDEIPIDDKEKEDEFKRRYALYVESYNAFSSTIDKYAPFYDENFYNSFLKIRSLCSKMGRIFKYYNFDIKYSASIIGSREEDLSVDDRKEVYIRIPDELKRETKDVQKGIRDYLKNLRIISN